MIKAEDQLGFQAWPRVIKQNFDIYNWRAEVSPLEVDAALTAYPGVKRAQTVGVPHDDLGEVVVACIVPHDDAKLTARAIQDFLKQQLASFKVPREVLFFQEDEFAVTGSEKVKTGALRELASARLGVQPAKALTEA